jgi:hypothetical protein
MKGINKTRYTNLVVLALIGIIISGVLIFLSAKENILQSDNYRKLLAIYSPQIGIPNATPISDFKLVPIHTVNSTPIVLDNGWYVYTDSDGEFSFSYPPIAIIVSNGQNSVDSSKSILLQFKIPEKPYQGMSIRIELNPKQLHSTDIAINLFGEGPQKSISPEFTKSLLPIIVGGLPAVQTTIPSRNTEITVIIPYKDKVFILEPVHDLAVTNVEKATLEMFYQILNSFVFVD